jgi:hypothetical protein
MGGSKSISARIIESLAVVLAVAIVSGWVWHLLGHLIPTLLVLIGLIALMWFLIRPR